MKNWHRWLDRPIRWFLLWGLAVWFVLAVGKPVPATIPASHVLLRGDAGKVPTSLVAEAGFQSDQGSGAPSDITQTAISAPQHTLERGRQLYQAERFAEAAQVWESLLTSLSLTDPQRAIVLNHLALAYYQQGQWTEATQAIAASLDVLRQADGSPAVTAQRAAVLNTQGRLQFAAGDTRAALETWKLATQAYEQVNDWEGAIGSLLNQSQAQQTLGFYPQAIQTLQLVDARLQSQPNDALKVSGLRSLGNALRLVGEGERSTQVLAQAATIARQLGDQPTLAKILLSQGNIASALSKPKDALALYDQAAQTLPNSGVQLRADLNRLNLLVKAPDQASSALALGRSLLTQVATLPPSRTAVEARVNLAHSLVQLTGKQPGDLQPQAIGQLLAIAVQQARDLQDRRSEAYALGTLGHLYETHQQWSEATDLTQQALLLAQAVNAADISYRWQWQLGRIFRQKGQIPAATAAYSQAVATLKSLRTDLVAVNPDVQFSFRDAVEPVYRDYVSLLLSDPSEAASQTNLVNARNAIESLQLAELENFFGQACLEGTPVQIDQVDRKAAVVYPIILPDRLEVILSLPGQPLSHYATPLTAQEVGQLIYNFRKDVTDVGVTPRSSAQKLYDALLRPAEAELNQLGIQTLVFVLDGGLRNIPMAALYNGKQYLVQKYAIALAPGLQLLDVKPLVREQLKVLPAGLTQSRQGFSALPNVGKEIQDIQATVQTSTALLDEAFTKPSLQQDLDRFTGPIVHLATHGQFSSKADETFLLTWDGKLTINELGRLLSAQELTRQRPIELLVLSACRTALGDNRAALGLSGMALRAGARSTIGTLWYVDDAATSSVMANFYQEYNQPSVTKAEALRRAQLTLLEKPEYDHPLFWAPFLLLGNWL